ncbi:MAG: ribose-phosphate diphosphokinase [Nitrososphaeria archaeon]|nr:ribose-phosphate pyrophosphokinase [Conexivisphaerales archaeon]
MSDIAVISGSSNAPLSYLLSRQLKVDLTPAEIRKFPDNEKYVRIDGDVSNKNVVILQSMAFRPDEYLIESLLLASAAKDAGAKSVTLAAAYFPYARQDERFKPGEPVSVSVVAQLLTAAGVDNLVTVDVHRHRVLDFASIFKGKWIDVSVMPYLVSYGKKSGLIDNDTFIVGPDSEAIQWAKIAAESAGLSNYGALRKKRFGDTEVTVSGELNLEGKKVFIVDDIISTGSTIIEASKAIKEMGGKLVGVACAHGLFVNEALYKLYREGISEVYSSDTVPNQTTRVSSAEALSKGVLEILK